MSLKLEVQCYKSVADNQDVLELKSGSVTWGFEKTFY